jgi:hypothetical protein
MLLYLDLHCFNRPFDDQGQERIARETAAVLAILQRIIDGLDKLAWSAILDFENFQHPILDRSIEIAGWAQHAVVNIAVNGQVSARAAELAAARLHALDAAHVACDEAGRCDRLLTCDNRLQRRARRLRLSVRVQNPIEYLEEREDV